MSGPRKRRLLKHLNPRAKAPRGLQYQNLVCFRFPLPVPHLDGFVPARASIGIRQGTQQNEPPDMGHPPHPSPQAEAFSCIGGKNRDVLRGNPGSLGDGKTSMGWGKLLDSEKRKWTAD